MTRTFQKVPRELQEGNRACLINHSQPQSVCPQDWNPPSSAGEHPTSLYKILQGHRGSGLSHWGGTLAFLSWLLPGPTVCPATPGRGVSAQGLSRESTPCPRAPGVSAVHKAVKPTTLSTSLCCVPRTRSEHNLPFPFLLVFKNVKKIK